MFIKVQVSSIKKKEIDTKESRIRARHPESPTIRPLTIC